MGVKNGLGIRMGISTGFCTVGNFGSDLRLDYTVLEVLKSCLAFSQLLKEMEF